MKPTIQNFPSLSLGIGAAIAVISALSAQPLLAQLVPNSSTQGFQNNEINNFDGAEQGSFNPLDLFHRANLGTRRSLGEYRQEQQNNLNDASTKFRQQQLELLRQRQQSESQNMPTPASEE
ncbi:hypothetical protein IQ249_13780 [Lusitaniella coriacea LEGE 07157]|uniref:Uncharacterized protein n=1 Tax=Lusitaniella coriacea LEGE 07157 TaxID=945747 RepID=A0A8J7DXC4_9CYAN|nr:hypothetical protein [Lusitaniella coriacea]MBE9116971.1 hypothetical protein [Lusitaniella coriacea LEGE 07157]